MIFKDVLEIKNGRNQRDVENPNGKYPIYGSGGIIGYANDYICDARTVIIGRKGNINRPLYVEEPFWNVDTAFGLIAKKNVLNPRYLYYFCKQYNFEKLNKTVTIPSLTKADLLTININIPRLDIQQQIVDILIKVEQIIFLYKRELQILDTLIKARFVEMFGDPKQNPKKYPIRQLSEFIKFLTSGPRGWAKYCADNGSEWFITIKNVKNCHIVVDNIQSIKAPDNAEAKRTRVQEGDLLISITADLGRTGVVTNAIAEHGAYINQHLTCIRLNRDKLEPKLEQFLYSNRPSNRTSLLYNKKIKPSGLIFLIQPSKILLGGIASCM